jgi:hypothetical protein
MKKHVCSYWCCLRIHFNWLRPHSTGHSRALKIPPQCGILLYGGYCRHRFAESFSLIGKKGLAVWHLIGAILFRPEKGPLSIALKLRSGLRFFYIGWLDAWGGSLDLLSDVGRAWNGGFKYGANNFKAGWCIKQIKWIQPMTGWSTYSTKKHNEKQNVRTTKCLNNKMSWTIKSKTKMSEALMSKCQNVQNKFRIH